MLDKLIDKYRNNDVNEVVYKLSYASKFIIVKGKTLCGSLIIIQEAFERYEERPELFKTHLYVHFFEHYLLNEGKGRFRIKILARLSKKINQYQLLKREQMELDKHRYNPDCLNNSIEVYLPKYNENTCSFGWVSKSSAMNFNKWLTSKERKAYIKRYSKKPTLKPAKSGL